MAEFDLTTFAVQRIDSTGLGIDTSATSALQQLAFRPLTEKFLSGVEEMIKADDVIRDLRKASLQTLDQVAATAANFFVVAKTGTFSTGTVSLFFKTPQDISIGIGQSFTASNSARFFATVPLSVTAAQISVQFDPIQGGYRLDIPAVQSSGTGPDFNIKAGAIVSMDGQTDNISLVTNLEDFSNSVAAETQVQLATRAIDSASQRNYTSPDSVKALLLQDARILAVSAIGSGDPEMIRDIQFSGVHGNGCQDVYVYGADPLVPFVTDQPLRPDFLPAFVFFGHDVTLGRYDAAVPISATPGPIVAVTKVEYGTGTGSGFLPIGILTDGEDYVQEFFGPGTAATKNSPEEVWRLRVIKQPALPATTIRVTALRNPLPSILQAELAANKARCLSLDSLHFAFTVAVIDVTAVVKPLSGASTNAGTYSAAVQALITSAPVAGEIDASDVIDALVQAGADEVFLPITMRVTIYYPDLSKSVIQVGNSISGTALVKGSFSERTIAFVAGTISIAVT